MSLASRIRARHRRSGGGIKPLVLPVSSGLAQWMYGDTVEQADLSEVTNWLDTSGNNRHATWSTGGKPQLIKNLQNGHAGLRFDNDRLNLDITWMVGVRWTLFAVVKNLDIAKTRKVLLATNTASFYWEMRDDVPDLMLTSGSGDYASTATNWSAAAYYLTARQRAATRNHRRNGVLLTQNSATSPGNLIASAPGGALGQAVWGDAAAYFKGDILAFGGYNRELTDGETTDTEGTLAEYYAI